MKRAKRLRGAVPVPPPPPARSFLRRPVIVLLMALIVVLSLGAYLWARGATVDTVTPPRLQGASESEEVAPAPVVENPSSPAAGGGGGSGELKTDTVRVNFRSGPPRDEMLVPDTPMGVESEGY